MNKNLEILEFHKISPPTTSHGKKFLPLPRIPTLRKPVRNWKRQTMLFSCPYSLVPRRSTGFRICGWDCGGQSPVPSFR